MPVLKIKPTPNGEGGGGQGGQGIEYLELEFNSRVSTTVEITQEDLEKLQNGAFIKATNIEENTTYTLIPVIEGAKYSSTIYDIVDPMLETTPFEFVQCKITANKLGGADVQFNKFYRDDLFNTVW